MRRAAGDRHLVVFGQRLAIGVLGPVTEPDSDVPAAQAADLGAPPAEVVNHVREDGQTHEVLEVDADGEVS